MKLIFRILLVTVLAFSVKTAEASHLLGGEISWQCLKSGPNTGKYIFTLVLYKECASGTAGLGTSQSIIGPNGNIPCTLQSSTDISPACLGGSGVYCGMTGSGNGAVERYAFVSAPTILNGVPPGAGWTFSWSSCCRPGGVVNTFTGGYYLRAKMYPYTPVGATTPKNANPCYDSSPTFKETGSLTICAGAPFVYNHLAADRDLDSLFVRFADPLQAAGSPVAWNTGYSTVSPYPSNLSNSGNGPVVVNGITGEVSMDIQTANPGSYASCYVIEAWKCGQGPNGPEPQLIAEVFRDVAIVVKTGCALNSEPVVYIDTAVYTRINQNGPKNYSTTVYPGDTINFQLLASDYDFNIGANQFQVIKFKSEGLQMANPLGGSTGCDGPAPCASFNPVYPQTTYSNQLSNNQEFFWVPECQHLDVGGNFCSPFNTFYFSMRMEDDGCPAPRIALTTFVVKVIAGDPSPVQVSCIGEDPVTGDINVGWQRAQTDSGLGFNYYLLLGSNQGKNGPYDTLQYTTDIDSLNASFGGGGGYKHFYMLKSTGLCDFLSEPSDTISLMELNLIATPAGSAEFADLSWNPIYSPLPYSSSGIYEIWTEAPAGSGNWSQVGSTTSLNYIDTVTVCNAVVNYQIRIQDTVRGCYSVSTIDSAHFSDKTNNDAIVLDSVSVNAAGNAAISWGPTKYSDVVSYYLYYNDIKLGWIIVDTIPVGATMPHEWTNSKADTRSEQFKVISVDSCGNQSDDKVVKPHTSIYLRNYLNKCEAYSRISWNTYEGFGADGVVGYRLWVQTSVGGSVVDPWKVLFVAAPKDTSYTQYKLENGSEYCYRVQVLDTTGRTASSNELCILAEVPIKSKVLYLSQVTNDPDRGSLTINTFIDGSADVQYFDLERAPSKLGPYTRIGKINKPVTAPYVITYNDFGAMPTQHHYYYRLSATDSCGGTDTVSNLGRNILLHVNPRPNLTNSLNWNPYYNWDGDVDRYEIYRQGADETNYKLVGNTNGDDTTFIDDISDYRESAGNFCYYVKAIEGKNSLGYVMDNGAPFESRSNAACLNQKARVYMATAFRPDSDILANRVFGPSMKFNEVSEYHFYVINRWGVTVFETTNPEEKWNGTYDGSDAQQGVYTYFLQYSTPGGVASEQRGNFSLLR